MLGLSCSWLVRTISVALESWSPSWWHSGVFPSCSCVLEVEMIQVCRPRSGIPNRCITDVGAISSGCCPCAVVFLHAEPYLWNILIPVTDKSKAAAWLQACFSILLTCVCFLQSELLWANGDRKCPCGAWPGEVGTLGWKQSLICEQCKLRSFLTLDLWMTPLKWVSEQHLFARWMEVFAWLREGLRTVYALGEINGILFAPSMFPSTSQALSDSSVNVPAESWPPDSHLSDYKAGPYGCFFLLKNSFR